MYGFRFHGSMGKEIAALRNRELYRIVRPCNYRGQQQLPDPAVAVRGYMLFTFNKASRRRAGAANSSVYCCSKQTN